MQIIPGNYVTQNHYQKNINTFKGRGMRKKALSRSMDSFDRSRKINRLTNVQRGVISGNLALLGLGLLTGNPLITFLGAGLGFSGYLYGKKQLEELTPNKIATVDNIDNSIKSINTDQTEVTSSTEVNRPSLREKIKSQNANQTNNPQATFQQKACQNIFLENISAKEARNISEKYSAIMKIKDEKEFVYALLENLRKDYKLETIPIILDDTYVSSTEGQMEGTAVLLPDYSKSRYVIKVNGNRTKEELLLSFVHEMHHLKQDIIAYQASTNDERIYNDINFVTEWRLSSPPSSSAFFNDSADDLARARMRDKNKMFNSLNISSNSMDKNYPLYKIARKIVRSQHDYPNKSAEAYRNSYIEQGAYIAEGLMQYLLSGAELPLYGELLNIEAIFSSIKDNIQDTENISDIESKIITKEEAIDKFNQTIKKYNINDLYLPQNYLKILENEDIDLIGSDVFFNTQIDNDGNTLLKTFFDIIPDEESKEDYSKICKIIKRYSKNLDFNITDSAGIPIIEKVLFSENKDAFDIIKDTEFDYSEQLDFTFKYIENLDFGVYVVKNIKLNNKDLLTAFDNRLDVLFIDLYNKRKDSPLFNLDNFRMTLRHYSDKLMQDIKNNADYEKQLERRSLFDDKAHEEYRQFRMNRDWLPEHMVEVLRKQAPELIP